MKVHPHYANLRSSWLRKPFSASGYRSWLIAETSLTARLQQRYTSFAVKPIMQRHAKPIQDEAVLLGLKPTRKVCIREVLLIGNQRPVVFAHSVLPPSSLRGQWYQLGKLGNRPLGAALFNNQRVIRTPLSYKKLSKNHALYQKAVKHLTHAPTYLWARRSVFSLNCANILVTEVFLPELFDE